jgi:hypothetical protein
VARCRACNTGGSRRALLGVDGNALLALASAGDDEDEPAELLEDETEESPVRGRRGGNAGDVSPARLELEQRLAEARSRRRRALAAEEDEEPVA